MLNYFKQFVPNAVKYKIRNLRVKEDQDATRLRLFGELAPLVPTIGQMFDGVPTFEDFKANGQEFLKIYKEHCQLKPTERMLDIGSGIGRKTIPLMSYFDENAEYLGLDITDEGIKWCTEKITTRKSNFKFQWIDVYSKYYNPLGKLAPKDYKFPLPSGHYTFVMLGSVFTHLLLEPVDNYLSEISRMLAPGGRCLISYFLLNEESEKLIEDKKSTLDFKFSTDNCKLVSVEFPEMATALPESVIFDIYSKYGLKISWIKYGSWCGRSSFLSYQDLIFAEKI